MDASPGTPGVLTHRMRDQRDPPRPLSGFAWTIAVFLILIATLGLINLIADLAYISVLDRFRSGQASASDVEDVQLGLAVLSGFSFIFFCLAAGFFIAWMYRAYVNLQRSSVVGLRFEPGWAIGAWFIPFFNLIRPKQMIDEIWRAGVVGVEVRDDSWRARPVSMLIQWWWGLWVASILVAVGVAVLSFDPDAATTGSVVVADVDELISTTSVALISVLCQLVAAILGALVVWRITRRGDGLRSALFAAAQAEAPGVAPPPGGEPAPPPPAGPPLQPPPPPPPAAPVQPPAAPVLPLPASDPPPPQGEPMSAGVEADGKLRCALCGWVFDDEAGVRTHMEVHHRESG